MSNDLGAILRRIDRRQRTLRASSGERVSGRSVSFAAGLSEDYLRSLRRQYERGTQVGVTPECDGHTNLGPPVGRRNGGDTVAAFREWRRVESATGRRGPYATAYKTELYATAYKPRPSRRA